MVCHDAVERREVERANGERVVFVLRDQADDAERICGQVGEAIVRQYGAGAGGDDGHVRALLSVLDDLLKELDDFSHGSKEVGG